MRILLLAYLICLIPMLSSLLIPEEYTFLALAGGIFTYGVGFILDVRMTTSFGIKTVIKYETSPLFSRLCCRFGFVLAIPLQLAIEIGMAFVLSVMNKIDLMLLGMCLFSLGMIHGVGWVRNTKSLIHRNA